MASDFIKVLQEVRGTGIPEAAYTDGIYHDITIKTTDSDGVTPRLGDGIYGSIQNMYVDVVDVIAPIAEEVVTVKGIATDIVTVASIEAEVKSIYADKITIDSLYTDKLTLDSLYADKAILDSLYADKVALDSIFADKATLDSLYVDKAALDSLYTDKATLDSLYADKTTLDRIFTSIANIDRVYTSIANVDTAAGSADNIDIVAANDTNVTVVATNDANVTIVAGSIEAVNNYSDTYYPPSLVNPTTRPDGSVMITGDLYFNNDATVNELRVYDGTVWKSAGSIVNGTTIRQNFIGDGVTTTFTITGGYDAGYADVYRMGYKLLNGDDVDISSGTDIVLAVAPAVDDIIDFIGYGTFDIANTYSVAAADLEFESVADNDVKLALKAEKVGDPLQSFKVADATLDDEALSKGQTDKKFALDTTHDFTADADYTLTTAQNGYGRLVLTDTTAVLTLARNVIVDDVSKGLYVTNNTAQDITVKTSAGTGVLIYAGQWVKLFNDGVNVVDSGTPVGVNQKWVDETANRAFAVTYTNTTGKSIQVMARQNASDAAQHIDVTIDGLSFTGFQTAGTTYNITSQAVVIPNGSTYQLDHSGALAVTQWLELK